MSDNELSINTQEMDALTASFYAEGFESQVNSHNPYCAKSQILPYHAWNAGFVDKHGRAPRKFIVSK